MDSMGELSRASAGNIDPASAARQPPKALSGPQDAAGGSGDSASIRHDTQALLQAMAALGQGLNADPQRGQKVEALRELAARGALHTDATATAEAWVDQEWGP